MPYCLYLRKSRADLEAEARGENETLSRHENILLSLAKKQNLNVTQIYKEIVSGETIASRPVMQQLLYEVSEGLWEGVLVMEVERLARGDTMDQGLVLQSFKYSETKIITPIKTYDPNNEFDEEYFEFGLFMSRREYKTINRRIQNGRLAAVKEGRYVANKPPYGYERIKIEKDKGYTLKILPKEAEIVRLIFNLYAIGKEENNTYKRLGFFSIAKYLNDLNIPTQTGIKWNSARIRDLLTNPVYIGKLRWKWRAAQKKIIDGKVIIQRPKSENPCTYNGLHPAIIDDNLFYKVQELIKEKSVVPTHTNTSIKNPLSGLVVCGKCGHVMIRRIYKKSADSLICNYNYCDNSSSVLAEVEKSVLEALAQWVEEYKLKWNFKAEEKSNNEITVMETSLKNIVDDINNTNKQINNTYDFLEQGLYSSEVFLERSKILNNKLKELNEKKVIIENKIKEKTHIEKSKKEIIPKIEKLLDVYYSLPSATAKNEMLKEVLEKVVYTKQKSNKRIKNNFELILYPRLPK